MNITKTAWKHIRRSPYQSLAAIITMFITFLLIGVFFLATLTSVLILKFFESKPQITVFFTDSVATKDVESLETMLKSTGIVASTKYVSKEDALNIYREQNKNDPLLLEMVTADILPASLEISATDPKYLKNLDEILKKTQGIEEVVYQKDVVDTLLQWTNSIRWGGGVLVGLLAIDSLLIIMTIISMKIALRKDEIEILKLVGASPWYIRFPFIYEGGLYGVTGSLLAWLLIIGIIIWLRPVLLAFLGVIPDIQLVLFQPTSTFTLISAAIFLTMLSLTGFLLGGLGSLVAIGRYLKF